MELENLVHRGITVDLPHGLPGKGGPQICPVEGCPGQLATRTEMRVHFMHRHARDTVVILEDGNLPHPRCPQCDILVPWHALNRMQLDAVQCARGAEQSIRPLSEEELKEISKRGFQAYGEPLEILTELRYLERLVTAGDDDWPVVVGNLQKARNIWERLSRILSREGADPKVSENFSGW